MTVRTGPTNYQLQMLLKELEPKIHHSRFWKRIAEDIQKPARQRREVNLYTIEQNAQDNEIIIVPGKVLSMGNLTKKVTVAALNFSAEAQRKIITAKGKTLSIRELLHQNPDGKKIKILG